MITEDDQYHYPLKQLVYTQHSVFNDLVKLYGLHVSQNSYLNIVQKRAIAVTLVIGIFSALKNPSIVHRGVKVMSSVMRKPTFWFLTWSATNQAVQLQKMSRGLKFWI